MGVWLGSVVCFSGLLLIGLGVRFGGWLRFLVSCEGWYNTHFGWFCRFRSFGNLGFVVGFRM